MSVCLTVYLLNEWNNLGKIFRGCLVGAQSYWVGSTCAQSPPCSTGPAYSPFPWSPSPLWPLVHVIPFWKAFDKANKKFELFFDFGF